MFVLQVCNRTNHTSNHYIWLRKMLFRLCLTNLYNNRFKFRGVDLRRNIDITRVISMNKKCFRVRLQIFHSKVGISILEKIFRKVLYLLFILITPVMSIFLPSATPMNLKRLLRKSKFDKNKTTFSATKCNFNGEVFHIKHNINCANQNVLYVLAYIGESKNSIREKSPSIQLKLN